MSIVNAAELDAVMREAFPNVTLLADLPLPPPTLYDRLTIAVYRQKDRTIEVIALLPREAIPQADGHP